MTTESRSLSKIEILDVSKKKRPKIRSEDGKVIKLPKKMSKETALALPAKTRISKLKGKGMRSILGDSAEEIHQLLEASKNDSATALMMKKLAQTTIDLLPYAEHAVRKSKGARGVYQINSLITSIREIMIDMQAAKDRGSVGEAMVEKVIRPAFLDLGMAIVLEDERALKELRSEFSTEDYKKIKEIHAESTRNLASRMQSSYLEIKKAAVEFMQK